MKRKIRGWLGIAVATGLIILAALYLSKGSFIMAIGIPVGIYVIIKYLPDVRNPRPQQREGEDTNAR